MKKILPIISYDKKYYESRSDAEDLGFLDVDFQGLDKLFPFLDIEKFQKILIEQVQLHGRFAFYFFKFYANEALIPHIEQIYDLILSDKKIYRKLFDNTSYQIDHLTLHDIKYRLFIYLYAFLSHLTPEYGKYNSIFKKENDRYKKCKICGSNFNVYKLPYWVYFGSNGFKECCFGCSLETPLKKELFYLLPQFVNSIGHIPNANFSYLNIASTLKISPENYINSLISYRKIGGIDHVKKKFGDRFSALVKTNSIEGGVLKSGRGVKCIAKDGHICNSLDEKYIDDWLGSKNIEHSKEPLYPKDNELNPKGLLRADWKIGDYLVEYFGLLGDPKYDKKIEIKTILAKKYQIKMIPIFPYDLKNLDKKLIF